MHSITSILPKIISVSSHPSLKPPLRDTLTSIEKSSHQMRRILSRAVRTTSQDTSAFLNLTLKSKAYGKSAVQYMSTSCDTICRPCRLNGRISCQSHRTLKGDELLLSSPALSHQMLSDVIKGKALACRVPNFISDEKAQLVAYRLMKNLPYEYYSYAEGSVGRIGFSFSEANSNEDREKYYEQATVSMRIIRETCGDIESPMDRVRIALQDAWKYGANLEMLDEGRKMFAGLCRVIEANKEIHPHQDMVWWYDGFSKKSQEILNQLAMNVYIKVPEEGGELEMWNWGFENQELYEKNAEGSYGIKKSKLPPPDLTIKPNVGDLILFNPGNLHCIRTGSGQRFTVSSFIGYRGEDKPLSYWS